MIYQRLSKRQKLAMLWWNQPKFKGRDAIICDGSIRSGKTVSMAVGFILWSMSNFDGQIFGICGRTIQSLRRNVILHLRDWVPEDLEISERRGENMLVVSDGCGHENIYYLFGGKDESSYALVQGITLAGALLDEVVLMPQSFVEQVIARCSVAGSKLWFNCNPGGPEHWFNKNWVLKSKEMNALHIHFTMQDNYTRLPIAILYGNDTHESELVGLRESIDCYDFVKSGFANQIDEAGVYWLLHNSGAMDDPDLAKFIQRMRSVRAATVDDADGTAAEAHTLDVPVEARKAKSGR